MPWNTNSPDSSISVKQNTTPMQQNTTYIKTTMNVDHFWDDSATTDGHHQFVQMTATNQADPTVITDPSLATDMDGVVYTRIKTPTESPSSQDAQAFLINATSTMQLLGIRAFACWDVGASPGFAISLNYSFNVTSVTRNNTGIYTIAFTNNLPSDNYLVLGGCVAVGTSSQDFTAFQSLNVAGTNSLSSVKANNQVVIVTPLLDASFPLADPVQAWLICFGG